MKVFGDKLKELRVAKSETQPQLAEILDVDIRQVQRYEKGTLPPLEKIKQLAIHYQYDFFRLFSDELFPDKIHRKSETCNKISGQSIEKLIENNIRLTEVIGKITEDGLRENTRDVHARLQAFLELLTEVSRGQKFFSVEEAVASYANKMYRIEMENRKMDIQAAKGT